MADIEGKRKPLPGKIQPVSVETPPDTWAHLHEYFGSEGLPLSIGKQVSRLQKRLESKPRLIASSSAVSSTTIEARTATVTTSIAQSSTFQPPNPTPSLSPPETTKRSSPTEASQPTSKQESMAKNDPPRIRMSSRLAQQFETTGKKLFYGPTEPSPEESQEALLKQTPYRIPTGKENVIPPRTPMSAHRVKSQMPFLTTKAQARPPSFGWGQPRRDAGDDDEADEQPAAASGDPSRSGSESSPEGPGSGPKAPSTQSTPSPSGSASNSQSPELTIQDLRVDDHVPASRPYRSRLDSMRDYDDSASLSKKPRHERYDSVKSTIDHVEAPRAQTLAPASKSEAKPNGSANIPASSHSYQTSHEKTQSRLTTNTTGTPTPAAIVPVAPVTPTVPSTSTPEDHPKIPQPSPAPQPKQSRPHSEGIAAIAQSLAVGTSKARPTKDAVARSGTAASPVVIPAQEALTPAPQTQPSVDVFGGRTVMMVNNRPYTRLSQVGKGGSSKVYKVLASNNRIFALKRVSFERADKVTIAGYVNEISLLQKLEKNSRIVRLYDAEINNQRGALSLLMEFGEIDLAHLLLNKREEQFDIHFIGLYWRQMLEAVAAIHDLKIVHSDLKPANFLLVEGSLKLIDFGIANAISNDTTNIHREGQLGTANYMSPEAISSNPASGTRKLGRSSDVWSLGCILYQMVYGKTPFSDIPNVFQKMSVITNPTHVIPFPQTTLSPLQIKTPSTKEDKGGSPPAGSEGKNMLSPTSASSSESALPSSCSSSSPNPNEQPQQFEIMVDPNLIRIMKGCLAREPKDRLSIPQLLNDVFIKPPCLSSM
ncbi:Dual-specificity kinase, spindle pole body (SPB) duplication and spindle checkpoint function [Podila minutissima]|nr:Dual-specificity kinase, spindle pole body (SPB) duplication and spindle checkpoint function [Podila minutissima]